jgi:hypothetical protein
MATDENLASYSKHLGLQVNVSTPVIKNRLCIRVGSTDNSNNYTTLMQAVERSRRYLDDQKRRECLPGSSVEREGSSTNPPSRQSFQASSPPLFDHPDIAYFYLLLALE